MKRSIF